MIMPFCAEYSFECFIINKTTWLLQLGSLQFVTVEKVGPAAAAAASTCTHSVMFIVHVKVKH